MVFDHCHNGTRDLTTTSAIVCAVTTFLALVASHIASKIKGMIIKATTVAIKQAPQAPQLAAQLTRPSPHHSRLHQYHHHPNIIANVSALVITLKIVVGSNRHHLHLDADSAAGTVIVTDATIAFIMITLSVVAFASPSPSAASRQGRCRPHHCPTHRQRQHLLNCTETIT